MNSARLLKIIFVILLLMTAGELAYYVYIQFNIKKDVVKDDTSLARTQIDIPTLTVLQEDKKQKITLDELNSVLDPKYQKFLPLSYDENKDRFYINIPAKSYVDLRKRMAIDYATWITLATYSKDLIDSYILTQRLKGKVTELKINKTSAGYKDLSFKLQGDEGSHIGHHYGENKLKTMKFVKVIDGKEIPTELGELKENDKITIEDKLNLTKYPRDPDLMTEQTVLTKY